MTPPNLRQIALAALQTRGLLSAFSPAAVHEAETAIPDSAEAGPLHDLRGLLWFSIDNDDTRDLDQLSFAE